MTWFYEVLNDKNHVVASAGGYITNKVAMAEGRKKARQLKALGRLGKLGVGTVKSGSEIRKS